MATIKKAQNGAKTTKKPLKLSEKYSNTADSLHREDNRKMKAAAAVIVDPKEPKWKQKSDSLVKSASKDFRAAMEARKKEFELRKKKMKNGGSLSSLDASTKRDKGIDPKGAYTTVQKKTLAGAKGKAKLTADKQLGATKMAKRGMKISKKK
jgi:hypothetical protein